MAAISTGAVDAGGVDAHGVDTRGVDADGDDPSHKLPIMLYSDPYNPRKLRFECTPITGSVFIVLKTGTPQALIKIPPHIVTKGEMFELNIFGVGQVQSVRVFQVSPVANLVFSNYILILEICDLIYMFLYYTLVKIPRLKRVRFFVPNKLFRTDGIMTSFRKTY